MLAMLLMSVFAAAAVLAISTIAASWRAHGAQAVELIRMARNLPEMRYFHVTMLAPAAEAPAAIWPRLRRQPRRMIIRPTVRLVETPRAAA